MKVAIMPYVLVRKDVMLVHTTITRSCSYRAKAKLAVLVPYFFLCFFERQPSQLTIS